MPTKHQAESYRNRGGVRFTCWCDVCDAAAGDLREQAVAIVKKLRSEGRSAFFEHIRDDSGAFYRVFVA